MLQQYDKTTEKLKIMLHAIGGYVHLVLKFDEDHVPNHLEVVIELPCSFHNLTINKTNTVLTVSSTEENQTVTMFFGTPFQNTGAYKTAIIAEGKTGWSRNYLHFCLNNITDNSRPAQNAGLNNIRFTIRPDGNYNFYPDPFYIGDRDFHQNMFWPDAEPVEYTRIPNLRYFVNRLKSITFLILFKPKIYF
jgi:hypothetical protein